MILIRKLAVLKLAHKKKWLIRYQVPFFDAFVLHTVNSFTRGNDFWVYTSYENHIACQVVTCISAFSFKTIRGPYWFMLIVLPYGVTLLSCSTQWKPGQYNAHFCQISIRHLRSIFFCLVEFLIEHSAKISTIIKIIIIMITETNMQPKWRFTHGHGNARLLSGWEVFDNLFVCVHV